MNDTLTLAIWPQDRTNRIFRNVILAVTGSIALTISAKISIPFYPVPMTMQTLVVLLIGMAYGWKLGGATILLYLAEGALGLPVFSGTPEKGIGIAYMMGGTGGYLLGFVIAASVAGYLASLGWDRNPLKIILAMLTGNIVIYVMGLLWLGALFGWDKPILDWGLKPFLFGDLIKIAIAAALLPACWRWVERSRGR
jgi:biotin transport system substrate-specific component